MKTLFLTILALVVLFAISMLVPAVKSFAVDVALKANDAVTSYMRRAGLMAMAITSTTYPAQTQGRIYNYRHLDDAASPAAISVNPGFRPRYVCIENLTDRIKYEWYEGMTGTHYLKTVAAGTRTLATDGALTVTTAEGSQPAIALAAADTLQNKQYEVHARA